LGTFLFFEASVHTDNTASSSNTGLVNVYNAESTIDLEGGKPKALKTIGNLTTSISTLRFNHDSQLLAIASNDKKDQMRMVRQYYIISQGFIHSTLMHRSIARH
jgi:hypothetical protein